MVDQIRVNGVLQVAPPVVWEEDIHRLAARIGLVFRVGDGMVDGVDDVRVRGEERVCFDFFEGKGNRFLAEGAADFFQGVKG